MERSHVYRKRTVEGKKGPNAHMRLRRLRRLRQENPSTLPQPLALHRPLPRSLGLCARRARSPPMSTGISSKGADERWSLAAQHLNLSALVGRWSLAAQHLNLCCLGHTQDSGERVSAGGGIRGRAARSGTRRMFWTARHVCDGAPAAYVTAWCGGGGCRRHEATHVPPGWRYVRGGCVGEPLSRGRAARGQRARLAPAADSC